MTSDPSDIVLGIDFGTTNSVCAVISDGDPKILENAEGDRITPSVVYYTQEQEQNRPLVGKPAQNKAREYPERVIASIKRSMGDSKTIEVDGEQYRVEDVAKDIIRKLLTDAADELGIEPSELVNAQITTPAYWESDRNEAVKRAARAAGFTGSVNTIKEPASAAIAYGRSRPGLDKTVGVYDLGGGTFDFALVDVEVGRSSSAGGEYNVITQSGDPHLGGDDWDQRIIDWIAENFEKETGVNPLEPHYDDDEEFAHLVREERIRANAREAKESLSDRGTSEVNIRIPFLMEISGASMDVDATLTETTFEALTDDLLEQTKDPVYTALEDAGKDPSAIDDIILIGGSTRMPQVTELVKSIFQQEPKQSVNPDEAVAAGAAIKGNEQNTLLLEVTPLSLGIGISGDRFKRMIHRNERLPAQTTEVFTTSSEGATAVRIPIYQGERDIASENRHLKTLIIDGMTPGSRNSAHIEVTFGVNKEGVIYVEAVENTRNKSVSADIEDENDLPDDYVSDKLQKAREMEEMDRRRQKVIEAQNEAKKAITEAERLLNEFPQVFEGDEDNHVKKHITNVRNVRKDNTATLGELREATEDLNEWVLEIGDRVRQTGARVNAGPKAGPDNEEPDVQTGESKDQHAGGPGTSVLNADGTGGDPSIRGETDDSSDSNQSEADLDKENFDVGGSSTDATEGDGSSVASENSTSEDNNDNEDSTSTAPGKTGQSTLTGGPTDEATTTDSDSTEDIYAPDETPTETGPRRGEQTESSSGDAMEMEDTDERAIGSTVDEDQWDDVGGNDSDPDDPAEMGRTSDTVDTTASPSDTNVNEGADDETNVTVNREDSDIIDTGNETHLPDDPTVDTADSTSDDNGDDDNEPDPSITDTPAESDNEDKTDTTDSTTESSTETSEETVDEGDEDKDNDDDDDDDEIVSGESGEQIELEDIDL